MVHKSDEQLGHVLIVGLGISGADVAEYLLDDKNKDRILSLTIFPGISLTSKVKRKALELETKGARVIEGTQNIEGEYDLGIISPGISEHNEFYIAAKKAAKELISEPEFAWRESPKRWVGITGTNGKTTTTMLTAHILNACGRKALPVGNIGTTCISAVAQREDEILVAELSSYQLSSIVDFKPQISVLLNITHDHLAWHETFEAYTKAKLRIFENQDQNDLAIICIDDPQLKEYAQILSDRGVRVETFSAHNAVNKDGKIEVSFKGKDYELCHADDLQIKGEHNLQNAIAASLVALAQGAHVRDISDALITFEPVEHRIEPVDVIRGVEYINDSKATNLDATLQALKAFSDTGIVLMLGGVDKGLPLEDFAQACVDSCSAIVCFGEARERFLHALVDSDRSDMVWLAGADSMAEALQSASSLALSGQVVLFSPACASFDEFENFEERGKRFKDLVRQLKELVS